MGIAFFLVTLLILGLVLVPRQRGKRYLSTLLLVWAAHIMFFATGIVELLLRSDHTVYFFRANGDVVTVPWHDYDLAAFLAAMGLWSIVAGYSFYRGHALSRLASVFDSVAPDTASIRRWALLLFALACIPYAAQGAINPMALIRHAAWARAQHYGMDDSASYSLQLSGSVLSVLNVLGLLSMMAIALTAYLTWARRWNPALLAFTGFFALLSFLSGVRQALFPMVFLFVIFPLYLEKKRAFRTVALVALIAVPIVGAVQSYYRNIGFHNVDVTRAVQHVSIAHSLGGEELNATASVLSMFPQRYPYFEGDSYYAVVVNPVPRFLWPDKPIGFSAHHARILGYKESTGASFSAGWIGEAYAQGGWWVIPIVGLVAGMFFRVVDNLLEWVGPFTAGLLFYLQTRFAFWVRGDSVAALGIALFLVIMMVGLVIIARRLRPAMEGVEDTLADATATADPTLPQASLPGANPG